MATFAQGKIEGYVGPQGTRCGRQPRAGDRGLHRRGPGTLDIAVQELDNEAIAQAILDARFRGVASGWWWSRTTCYREAAAVRARNRARMKRRRPRRVQWGAETGEKSLEENRRILTALLRCKWTSRPTTTRRSSTRSSSSGTTAATRGHLRAALRLGQLHRDRPHHNLNHMVIFHNVKICKEYLVEFASIRAGHFGRGEHGDVPSAQHQRGTGEGAVRAGPHARTRDHEADAQGDRPGGLRHLHVLRLVGHRRHDGGAAGRRPARAGAVDPGQGMQVWAATHDLDGPASRSSSPTARHRSASCTTS